MVSLYRAEDTTLGRQPFPAESVTDRCEEALDFYRGILAAVPNHPIPLGGMPARAVEGNQ